MLGDLLGHFFAVFFMRPPSTGRIKLPSSQAVKDGLRMRSDPQIALLESGQGMARVLS